MGIILWIIFGGFAGWAASLIMSTSDQKGFTANIFVGIIGFVIGGWVISLLAKDGVAAFNVYSFLITLLGAMILIRVVRTITLRRSRVRVNTYQPQTIRDSEVIKQKYIQ